MSKRFSKTLLLLVLSTVTFFDSFAQLSAPRPEAVYGGRIRGMCGISIAPDSSRIFITTESANSMFVADVYAPGPALAKFDTFKVVPALNAEAGFGGNIEKLSGHAASRSAFFLHQNTLYKTTAQATAPSTIAGPGVAQFTIEQDHLFYILGPNLHFGTLDASGGFTASLNSPLLLPVGSNNPSIHIHPHSGHVFAYEAGPAPKLYYLNQAYDSIFAAASFTDVSPTTLSPSIPWQVFGIGPNGKLYIAGSDVQNKHLAIANGPFDAWSSYNTGMFGAAGGNLAFSGDSSNFSVYFGSAYNHNNGLVSYWRNLGQPGGFETHPNDGYVLVDPSLPKIIYLTTDQGIGASVDQGERIFEINEGVEAVQVKDFDMTGDKNTAWLASKSGIRKVSNYLTQPAWTPAIFPNGDGSPFHAVAMATGDTNTVYAGNIRVYKSIHGGISWATLFSATDPPYHFPAFASPNQGASRITSLEVCAWDTSLIMVGYAIDEVEEGGLFWSPDGGASWDQILLHAPDSGMDVDVMDIMFNQEDSVTVAYVSVSYDANSPAGVNVYRLTRNDTAWTVQQDMDASGTSTGSAFTASIHDLAKSSTGDTLFACGTDASSNTPVAYYKPIDSTGLWTPFGSNGFPSLPNQQGYAITLGIDTVYVAVDNEVHYLAKGSDTWELGYAYPVGTEINFLYYDELLVGTGTGLYGHAGPMQQSTNIAAGIPASSLGIFPNPSRDQVLVSFENPRQLPHSVSVYDINGKQVFREQVRQSTFSLDVSQWAEGLYIVRIAGLGTQQSGKLLVRK